MIRKDDEGKIHIKETADPSAATDASVGAVLGGVVGLVAGPVGLSAGGGAIAGWLAARRDRGFKNDRLERVGRDLSSGNSAIIAVVERTRVEEFEKELVDAGADVLTEALAQEIATELNAEEEFALTPTS